jgi:hypothetical protein
LLICGIGVFQPEVFRGCGLSLLHVKHFTNNLQPDGLHFTGSKIDMFAAMKTTSDRLHSSSSESAFVVLCGLFLLLFSDLTLAPNVILFVADGLRQGSVNDEDASIDSVPTGEIATPDFRQWFIRWDRHHLDPLRCEADRGS